MLDKIDATLRDNEYQGEPIRMYLAGGMAVNYYCGSRYTADVDASFSRRMALDYNELVVDFIDSTGKPSQIYFDAAYPRACRGCCELLCRGPEATPEHIEIICKRMQGPDLPPIPTH